MCFIKYSNSIILLNSNIVVVTITIINLKCLYCINNLNYSNQSSFNRHLYILDLSYHIHYMSLSIIFVKTMPLLIVLTFNTGISTLIDTSKVYSLFALIFKYPFTNYPLFTAKGSLNKSLV